MAKKLSLARRFGCANDGASAVEFALILPLFILLLFGIVELSRMMFVSSSVQYSVDRAARFAAIDADVSDADIENEINHLLAISNSPSVDISISRIMVGATTIARVSAHYDHLVSGPFIPAFTVGWDFETNVPLP
jgi:Flp pilus assembly protein TadG